MCVDFSDLNRASLKDDFPLLHIDILLDNTSEHALVSFMDGYAGYNQTLMVEEDMEKLLLSPHEAYIVTPLCLSV